MNRRSFIYYGIIIYVLILLSSNILALTFEEEIDLDRQNVAIIKDKCLKLKQKNFEDLKDPVLKFSHLYLNTLLDYIIDHNQTILKRRGLDKNYFCIYILDGKKDETTDQGDGLILFKIQDLVLPFVEKNDVDIAGIISHELAHDILNHKHLLSKTQVRVYKEFMEDDSIKDKTVDNFDKYKKKHKDLVMQERKYEIEADELGFEIYLNSNFVHEKYAIFFLKTLEIIPYHYLFNDEKSKTMFSYLSDTDFLFFKTVSNSQGCIKLGEDYLKQNKLHEFMNKIQYIPDYEDSHPTACWRFWNILQKIMFSKDPDTLKKNTLLDAIFLKIDLNEYEHLKDIKDSITKQDLQKVNFYFLDVLHHMTSNNNASSKMKYTIDTTSKKAMFNESDNFFTIKFYSFLVRPLLETIYIIPTTNLPENSN